MQGSTSDKIAGYYTPTLSPHSGFTPTAQLLYVLELFLGLFISYCLKILFAL